MTDHEVLVIRTPRFGDDRGWFQEIWSQPRFEAAGLSCDFVQDNHSRSGQVGVVRGLHFQKPPFAQAKLVRCVRGAILDVVVDLRCGAPTYGQAYSVTLTETGGEQVLVPECFAHGFVTLTPDAEVIYKVTAPYSPEHEGGVMWNDPALGVDWPVSEAEATLSPRDLVWPSWADFVSPFTGQLPSRLREIDLGCSGV